jgi:hypothetical protein
MHEETAPERWQKENHPDPRNLPVRPVGPIEGPALNRYAAVIIAVIGAGIAAAGLVAMLVPLLIAGVVVLVVGVLWYIMGRLSKET